MQTSDSSVYVMCAHGNDVQVRIKTYCNKNVTQTICLNFNVSLHEQKLFSFKEFICLVKWLSNSQPNFFVQLITALAIKLFFDEKCYWCQKWLDECIPGSACNKATILHRKRFAKLDTFGYKRGWYRLKQYKILILYITMLK